MNKKEGESKLSLTPKTAHNIAFTVHKRHYYDCREVDDVLDALLELVDSMEESRNCAEQRLREYESHIAGILLDCQKLKAQAQIAVDGGEQLCEDADDSADNGGVAEESLDENADENSEANTEENRGNTERNTEDSI